MAESDIFISYARSTEPGARRLEQALQKAGYSVWRDAELPGNRPFAEVIEEKLQASRAVVVLWSADAAKSQWVRAEADFARHRNALVQLSLDRTEPPIPFNQIHCLDFKGWRGGQSGECWRKLIETLDEVLQREPPAADSRRLGVASALLDRLGERGRLLAAVAVGVLLAAGLGVWALRLGPMRPPQNGRIEVAEFSVPPADSALRQSATEISRSLIRILSSNGVPTTQAGAGGGDGAAELKIDGALERGAKGPVFNGQLTETSSGEVLWSWRVDDTVTDEADFTGYVPDGYSAVLHCALEDRKTAKAPISTRALGLYLNACAAVLLDSGASRMLAVTRQLVAAAPDFAAAHAMHAIAAGEVAKGEHPADDVDALRSEGRAAVERAISLDRTFPKTYVASAILRPPTDYADQERDLMTALKYAPDLPPPLHLLGILLRNTGRFREAAEELAATAAAADPRTGVSGYGEAALWWASIGERDKAEEAVLHLETAAPSQAGFVRWNIALWLDEPKAALAELRKHDQIVSPAARACAEGFLTRLANAGATPLKGLPEPCAKSPAERRIRMLAREGDIDGTYREVQAAMQGKDFQPSVLFYPELKAVRADPRFASLATGLGLMRYWQATGHLPDFCTSGEHPPACALLPKSPVAAR
jgi:hypothetical protein